MKKRFFNGEELTEDSILKARKFFSDNRIVCIEKVKTGKIKIYCDKEEFYEREEINSRDYLDGVNDYTFPLLQRAYYIQTGKIVALFQDK